MTDREPTPVEMDHLKWMAQTTLPIGMSLPSRLAISMVDKDWIEWAPPMFIMPEGSPYSAARITSTGRALIAVYGGGKKYRHGRKWPWTLPQHRGEFSEEIAYTEMMNARTKTPTR